MATITLITPAEAQTRADENLNKLVSDTLYKIDTAIRQAADKGNYSVRFDFRSVELGDDQQTAVNSVKQTLLDLQYEVTVHSQFNAGGTVYEIIVVGWEHTTDEPDPEQAPED